MVTRVAIPSPPETLDRRFHGLFRPDTELGDPGEVQRDCPRFTGGDGECRRRLAQDRRAEVLAIAEAEHHVHPPAFARSYERVTRLGLEAPLLAPSGIQLESGPRRLEAFECAPADSLDPIGGGAGDFGRECQ